MINDQKLYDYLNQDVIENLMPINLDFVTAQSTLSPKWAIRFNQLNEESMYQELRFIIQELMVMQIDETQRLNLMYEVTKVGQVLISKLHILYWNQAGLLNHEQQTALDRVLSIYYSMTIFYYSVWQRLSSKIDSVEPSVSSLSILKNFGKASTTPQDVIKRCIFSMMVLLKQSLLEKQIGYRQDTQVIWQYLNACYNFVRSYGWQSYSFNLNTLLNYNGKISIEQIYRQCLLVDMIQPYAYRRHDLLKLHTGLTEWADYLEVTSDPVTKPFLYVDLQGNTGPQLLSTQSTYNPFSVNSTALFINLQPILVKLTRLIEQANKPAANAGQIRLAKLVYPNLESILKVPTPYVDTHEPCQIVVGFHQIHFILAGKTSLDNLIHSHQLPERIRPAINTGKNFEQPSQALITGINQQYLKLYFPYLYPHTDKTSHSLRTPTVTSINHFQVHSLIAIYGSSMKDKSWQVGKIILLKQQSLDRPNQQFTDANAHHEVGMELQIELLGKGIVPCGVRLINPESRLPRFMPALIIPKSEELGRSVTSLMMSRFGYQSGDKIIIRIDNKEVHAQLTDLISITDDAEEYNFVRIA